MSLDQKLKTGGTQYKCWCRLNMLRPDLFLLSWIACSLLQSFEQKVSDILRILWRMNLSEHLTFGLSNELALNATSTSCSLYFASVPVVYFFAWCLHIFGSSVSNPHQSFQIHFPFSYQSTWKWNTKASFFPRMQYNNIVCTPTATYLKAGAEWLSAWSIIGSSIQHLLNDQCCFL